jgi:cell division cycle 14
MRQTPDEAHAPLIHANPPFVTYRDAGYGSATYFLSIHDCLRGFYKAMQFGLVQLDNYDLKEYEFYERVENGDMNWLGDKFLALASPKDDQPSMPVSRNGGKSLAGCDIHSAYRKSDLIKFLKSRGVGTIIRLNNNVYDRQEFVDAGIEHIDLYFPDGSTPPDGILKRFMDICESRPGPIAVHCKAGLGRTGSLIGCYYMKHLRMTAAEMIAYFRVMRPGTVVGPQQNWLERYFPPINAQYATKTMENDTTAPPTRLNLMHRPIQRRFIHEILHGTDPIPSIHHPTPRYQHVPG